jgi:hypothetical protein
MKKLFPLLLLVFAPFLSNAQWFINDLNTFENPDSLLAIDTAYADNIWSIGQPHKTFFDSAYTVPNAIVTDPVHFYPANNRSTFTVRISYGNMFPNLRSSIMFFHKYDTDSLHDGGYIEVSYDSCATWTNIANDPWINFYYGDYGSGPNPVIWDGNNAYTGRSKSTWGLTNGWRFDGIFWCYWEFTGQPAFLRFVFSSDSIAENREGWMIDNIEVNTDICEGVNEKEIPDLITLAPNPACDRLTLQRKYTGSSGDIDIVSMEGRLMFRRYQVQENTIDVSSWASGTYVLRYTDGHGFVVKKFVVSH